MARITRTEVVDLTDADLAEIQDLRTRAADFFIECGDPPPTPESFQADLDDLPDGYSRADEFIVRAYRDDRVVGYSEVLRRFTDTDQWMIGIVLVDADLRSDGIGGAIVQAIVDAAAEAGVASLAVGVIALREGSLRFWRREGFTSEVRRRPITVRGVETELVRLVRSL